MRLKGKINDVVKNSKGDVIVSFAIDNYSIRDIIDKTNENEIYSIEIKKWKDKRTLDQNSLLWALISEIDKTINGVATPDSEMSIYISALLKAGAKYTTMVVEKKAEMMLREKFRAVQFLHNYATDDNYGVYRLYYGSSKMTKEEFALLIDAIKQIAYDCGVEMKYWEEVLK